MDIETAWKRLEDASRPQYPDAWGRIEEAARNLALAVYEAAAQHSPGTQGTEFDMFGDLRKRIEALKVGG